MRTVFFILLFLPVLCFAQVPSSTYQFLNLPVNGRDALLNKISSSVLDSSFSQAANNISLLLPSQAGQASLTYASYVADIHGGSMHYAFTKDRWGVFMPSVQYFFQGNYLETNEFGDILREFSASDLSVNMAHANAFKNHFRYGVQVRFLYSQYLQYSSLGFSSDYSLYFSKKPNRYGFTLSVLNLGMPFKNYVENQREQLPLNIQLSSSVKLAKSPLVLHVAYNYLNQWDLSYEQKYLSTDPFTGEVSENTLNASNLMKHITVGVDFVPSQKIRFGLSFDYKRQSELRYSVFSRLAGFGMGLGIKTKKWNIDYTLYGNGVSLFSNFITLSTNIHQRIRK